MCRPMPALPRLPWPMALDVKAGSQAAAGG